MRSGRGKVLVLGLGNDLLSDDAVGLHVVRLLAQDGLNPDSLDLRETTEMGLALLDWLVGYRAAVLVDSIQTGQAPPGTIYELDATGFRRLTGRTPHFLGVAETLALGRALGLPMPQQVRVIAVEVADPWTLGTALTPAVQQALPRAVERVRQAIQVLETGEPAPAPPLDARQPDQPQQ